MSVILKLDKKTAVILVSGPIGVDAIEELAAQADKAVAAGSSLVSIDVSRATDIDAAGVTGLLNLRVGLLDRGMDLDIIEAPREIAATLRLLKLGDLLNLQKGSISQ